jgi:hypothetical protein
MSENQPAHPCDEQLGGDGVTAARWPAWQIALLWLALVVGVAIEIAAEFQGF